ncbi:MAG: hypothetical protein C4B59_06765 [Candidatus Methanogaster sp.]|uniref:Uncharacterized protein n=1 Tax=Candidatus Methanogaster sp. TaxID=3386292 RepID=A0AC61L356_9EURY|nr:MAG: hypothetical protein C4B59_06765 [ANME-2 cluster archaeon]
MKAKHESMKNHVPNGLLTLIVAAILLASIAPIASAGWDYRKPVTINNPGDTLSDYQVLVTLNSSNFDYSKASPDGSDIGFVDGDNTVALNYWIEEWNATGDSRIWVAVPSVDGSGSTTIYMYYGNLGASDARDGDATFEFFDDFPGTSLDKNKWQLGDGVPYQCYPIDYRVSNSTLVTWSYTPQWKSIQSDYTISSSETTIVEARVKSDAHDSWHILGLKDHSYINRNRFCVLFEGYPENHIGIQTKTPSEWNRPHDLGVMQKNRWYKLKIIKSAENTMGAELIDNNGTLIGDYHTTLYSWDASKWQIVQWKYDNVYSYWDYVFVRKYTSSEPITTVGAEESDPPRPPIPTYIRSTDTDDDGVPNVWDADNSTPAEYWTDSQGIGRMWGDMNGDGKLTSVDALMILQVAAEAISL